MRYSLQVLGVPNGETQSSFLLQMDQESFLFNVPEATQRVAVQHKCRLLKIKNIFLTKLDWNALGGLPGMLLTLGDMSKNAIKVHGPQGLASFFNAKRHFIYRNPQSNQNIIEWNKQETTFQNDSVSIQPILVESQEQVCVSYLVQGPKKPGKFNPVKAKRLKLDPALHYKRLINGESIVLEDGTCVHPSECVSSEEKGKRFLIVECPTLSFIPSVLSRMDPDTLQDVCLVIHNIGQGVLENQEYVNWLSSFQETVQHMIFSKDYCSDSLVFTSTAQLLSHLSCLDSKIFQKPYESLECKSLPDTLPKKTVAGKILAQFQFEPQLALDESLCLKTLFEPEEPSHDFLQKCDSDSLLETCCSRNSIHIIPLGTGSSMPSKYRNVSSNLVQFPNSNLLLDCGEGTLGQLFRRFGPIELQKQLSRLRLIFLSHLHADHHLGTIRVLLAALQASQHVLYLVAPGPFWNFVKEYSLHCQSLSLDRIQFLDSSQLEIHDESLLKDMEWVQARTVPVKHCPLAFGFVFQTQNELKLTFSGDCRPSEELIVHGMHSDILIHEATFEDEKLEDAMKKMHCTLGEALDVASRMNAKNVLLTHFSQRYPKAVTRQQSDYQGNIAFAFDLMSIGLSDFKKLHSAESALLELNPEKK